ncbi:reverse transcriptase domain-containing protein [Tanacetum coccineum]
MRTRYSSNLVGNSSSNPTTTNPKCHNHRRSNQRVEQVALEESPVVTMADQRTMAKLLRAPTEGYAEAIVVPPILAKPFGLKHSLINMMTSDQFFRLEKDNPHDHIRCYPTSSFCKTVEEICVTCGGPHPYYQCLAADGNTFLEYRDNIQGYVAAATGMGSLPSNTVANPKGELKAITTRSGLVLDGPFVPMPPPFINPEEDERVEETLTDPEHGILVNPHITYRSRMNQENRKKNDDVQIHKFWQMFKQLHINITLADALILIPKYQKMLKILLSNKEKLLSYKLHTLMKNCSAVILKKLPEKLRDPGKFLIPCGFSELKCKALADLANREIYTLVGIARDVFVPVGKFTFPADFVIVDYESDPRVPLILGRPFLRTARALIDIHGEEMILRDGNERLTLNMRHDTSSYSTQPHQESINMIDVYNVSHKETLEDLFATNHPSGNPTSSLTSHADLTSPEVNDDIFDPGGGIIENLLNIDKT